MLNALQQDNPSILIFTLRPLTDSGNSEFHSNENKERRVNGADKKLGTQNQRNVAVRRLINSQNESRSQI